MKWPPDRELARVHFFEAVDIITDDEFDLLMLMKEQTPTDEDLSEWEKMIEDMAKAS